MINNIKDKLQNMINCYESSRTEENNEAVNNIVYGLVLAVATIEGELRNARYKE